MSLNKQQRQMVSACFLFQGMGEQELDSFLETLTAVRFAAGQAIYTASQFQKSIGILMEGSATVRKGREVELNTLSQGDCFGVAGLFHATEEYVATVEARTAAEIVFITDAQLTALFVQYPCAAVNYIAFLSRRIYFLNRKIDSFTAPTTQAGLRLYLLENLRDGVVTVAGGYSQLARQLNMGRASLYRSLEQLEKQNVIRRTEKTITILDLNALRR